MDIFRELCSCLLSPMANLTSNISIKVRLMKYSRLQGPNLINTTNHFQCKKRKLFIPEEDKHDI